MTNPENLFTEEELKNLAKSLQMEKRREFPKDEVERIWTWAIRVRVSNNFLEGILHGDLEVDKWDGDEPLFIPSKKLMENVKNHDVQQHYAQTN